MPSELQRVARGLVDCFDEIPRVVDQLLRTAARCRENAQVALIASRGQATVAAQQLDAAARACEAAAHYLQMAPPKARGWAEALTGTPGPSTSRPSSDSADRNKSTSGTGVEIRTTRLTATYADLEVAEDNEPPLVTVARKAFEKYRKTQQQDDQETPTEPLEIEITVTETGEIILEERDEKEEAKREQRLTRDFEFTPDRDDEDEPPEYEERDEKEEAEREQRLTADHGIDTDLTEAVKALLAAMPPDQQWQHAIITITPDSPEATFDDPESANPAPLVVDIQVPNLRSERADDGEEPPAVEVDGPAVELDEADADFVAYRGELAEAGRIRPIVGDGPQTDFQRKHCGPIEFRLTRDELLPRAVWADGLDHLLRRAQDAKYVAPSSDSSFYRPDSLPPFLRKVAEEKNDHMLLKYRDVIADGSNPVEGLEIITNDGAAAAYFQDRMRALDIPGQVTLKQGEDS